MPGGQLSRTYTISSSPSRPLSISVTVKARPGSLGTRWMLDHLKPGMRLRAHGPALEEVPVVTTAPSGSAKIVFAASGLSVPCDGSETVLAVARR